MIWFNGFPFLDNKEEHVFNVPVSHAMTTDPLSLPASDFPVREAEHLLNDNKFQGFPVVEDRTSKTLVGYIGRTELRYAIDRARKEGMVAPNARCVFTNEAAEAAVARRASAPQHARSLETFDAIQRSVGAAFVDFSRYVDHTPLTVHPRLPLETVMEIFKKMGPRVILVEHRGRLTGLVTVKDCLKYQFKVEASGHSVSPGDEGMERAYGLLRGVALWVDGWLSVVRRKVGIRGGGSGEVRLVSPVVREGERGEEFAVGDEDDEDAELGRDLELEDRRRDR